MIGRMGIGLIPADYGGVLVGVAAVGETTEVVRDTHVALDVASLTGYGPLSLVP